MRALDRRTKELIFITGLTLLRAERRQIQAGVLAWQEVVGADRVEPTVDALEA